jgi:hypothetical protein
VLEAKERAAKVTAELEAGGNARYDAMCRAAVSAHVVADPTIRTGPWDYRTPLEFSRPYPREGCRPYADVRVEGMPKRPIEQVVRHELAACMRRFEEAAGTTLASVIGVGTDDAALDWLCHDRELRTGYYPDAGERKLAELRAAIDKRFGKTEEIEINDAGRKRTVFADTTGW